MAMALAVAAALTPSMAGAETGAEIEMVVQLGDSYSAGYGALEADVAADSGSCDDPDRSAPDVTPGGRLAAAHGATLVFAACGGAEIPDVVEQFRRIRSDIAGDGAGTVIVFTAGGNDLRSERGEMWTGLITRCILWDFSCERRSANRPANIDEVAEDIAALVAEIRTAVPAATIRVLGYPELMQRTPGCWGMTGIDRAEADFLDGIARSLNDALEASVGGAATADAFVNPEAAFDDQGACQVAWSGERFVNDVEFVPWSVTISANSLHPTAEGYDAYSQLLAASLT